MSAHKDHPEVKTAREMCKSDEKNFFQNIRNRGILEDNKEQCKSHTPLFQSQKKCVGDVVICSKCGSFYSRKFFYRHKVKCQADDTVLPQPVNMTMLGPVYAKSDEGFKTLVSGIQSDDIGKVCKTDPTIQIVGARLWEKDKAKPDKSMEVKKSVRTSMRMLGKLYISFQEHMPEGQTTNGARDMFDRENFQTLREDISNVTNKCTTKDPDDPGIKYGLKSNLYYLLLNAATILKGSHLEKKGEEKLAEELDHFMVILKLNENVIFGDAKYQINKARQERLRLPSRTPDEQDVAKLRKHSISKIQQITDVYHQHFTLHEFVCLRNAVCCRLTLFNGRRGGGGAKSTEDMPVA